MMCGKQNRRAGTGSQQRWCKNSSLHGRLNIRALKGHCRLCKLVMETEAEGNQWCASEVGMSSSTLDGLLGHSVPPVPCQGQGREEAGRSCCHIGVAINNTISLWLICTSQVSLPGEDSL